jgi:hypothetical protein
MSDDISKRLDALERRVAETRQGLCDLAEIRMGATSLKSEDDACNRLICRLKLEPEPKPLSAFRKWWDDNWRTLDGGIDGVSIGTARAAWNGLVACLRKHDWADGSRTFNEIIDSFVEPTDEP